MYLLIALLIGLVAVALATFAFNRAVGFVLMQVALGLFVIYGVYWLSLVLLKRDELVVAKKTSTVGNSRTLIIDGFADAFNLSGTVYDTLNPASISFAYLPRSVNRYGGAQYTYQFWILLTNVTPENIGSKDILVRGDIRPYNVMKVDARTNAVVSRTEDVLVKCPRIRFNGAYDEMMVEVNALGDPLPKPFRISSTPGDVEETPADATRFNVMRLVPNKWALYTFVFQDNVELNEFERGTEMRFYINELLYQRHTTPDAIRQNNGNLYLFPSGPVQGCKIGNLAYYNYALGEGDISRTVSAGPPKHANVVSAAPTATPLFLTEYNKLDNYSR